MLSWSSLFSSPKEMTATVGGIKHLKMKRESCARCRERINVGSSSLWTGERYNKIFSFEAAFLIYEGKLKKTALKLDKV